MKRLNKKGFTLVELLAVIVILAIVVGITLVTVLPTLSDSKEKAFQTAVDTIRVFVQEQYDICSIGEQSLTGAPKISFTTQNGNSCGKVSDMGEVIANAGYSDADINKETMEVNISASGRVSVKAEATTTGKFNGGGTKTSN